MSYVRKFTVAQVREIRARYEEWKKHRPKQLAREYGVCLSAIRKVIDGEAYKWVR